MDSTKKLDFLETIAFKFAVAEKDVQLEKLIQQHLIAILELLSEDDVKSKIIEILSHLNKRIRSRNEIKLPICDLAALFVKSPSTIKNFAVIYLDMGYERASIEEKATCFPLLVNHLADITPSQRVPIYHVLLNTIDTVPLNEYEKHFEKLWDTNKSFEECKDILLEFLLDVLIFDVSDAETVPGLSKTAMETVTRNRKKTFTIPDLVHIKLSVLKFIHHKGWFSENDVFIHLLVASCTMRDDVVRSADDYLRRLGKPDLENEKIVRQLYTLYQGQDPERPQDESREPVDSVLQNKILFYLSKSIRGANTMPSAIRVALHAIFGQSSTLKTIQAGMLFLHWLCRTVDQKAIQATSQIMKPSLMKFLQEHADAHGTDIETLRGQSYVILGIFAKRVPSIVEKDPSLIFYLFERLCLEPPSVCISIQESLFTLMDALRSVSEDVKEAILKTLFKFAVRDEHAARHVAVKFVNELYAFDFLPARYLCLLLSHDHKMEIKEEARKGCDYDVLALKSASAHKSSKPTAIVFPSFPVTVQYFHEQTRQPKEDGEGTKAMYPIGYHTQEVFLEIIKFIHLTMVNRDPLIAPDEQTRAHIRDVFSANENSMENYIDLLKLGILTPHAGGVVQRSCLLYLYEVATLAGSSCQTHLHTLSLSQLTPILSSTYEETRDTAARLMGFLASQTSPSPSSLIDEQLSVAAKADDKNIHAEARHGSLLFISYYVLYGGQANSDTFHPQILRLIHRYVCTDRRSIYDQLFVITACHVIVTLCWTFQSSMSLTDRMAFHKALKDTLIDALIRYVKENKDSVAVVRRILLTLGSISWIPEEEKKEKEEKKEDEEEKSNTLSSIALFSNTLSQSSSPKSIADTLTTLYFGYFQSLKAPEIQLAVGEGVSLYVLGSQARLLLDPHFLHDNNKMVSPSQMATRCHTVLQTLLSGVLSQKTTLITRQSTCLWLMCLVKHASTHALDLLVPQLGALQSAFLDLLADRDDLTQDAASKAIGLLFDVSTPDMRAQLVAQLTSTLSTGHAPSEDLSQKDSAAVTASAVPLGTYRELCSLATDLQQPDLLYSLLHLANHHTLWHSKTGAAFGFAEIAMRASDVLTPHLPQLVPRLFRAQYDPQRELSEACRAIWRALLPDPAAAVQQHFDALMRDLIAALGDKLWRQREASCAALADLLPSRTQQQMAPYAVSLWTMAFRALDDIKASVRERALFLCQTLAKRLLNEKEEEASSSTSEAAVVVPLLLEKGLVSEAQEVRQWSLSTLLALCESSSVGGKKGTRSTTLRVHAADILLALLESLSEWEPAAVGYWRFHAGDRQSQWDQTRASLTKTSPVMSAILTSVDHLDRTPNEHTAAPMTSRVVTRLTELLRRNVGLPTKVGCTHVIVYGVSHQPGIWTACCHGNGMVQLLAVLRDAVLSETNGLLANQMAVALGYVARLVPLDTFSQLMVFLGTQCGLLLSENAAAALQQQHSSTRRRVVAMAVHECSKHASDALRACATDVVPLCFYGMHDAQPATRDAWRDVCDEHGFASDSSLRLYADDVWRQLTLSLRSASWRHRAQASRCIDTLCRALSAEALCRPQEGLRALWDAVAVTRRWRGKSQALWALAKVIAGSEGGFPTEIATRRQWRSLIIKELQRAAQGGVEEDDEKEEEEEEEEQAMKGMENSEARPVRTLGDESGRRTSQQIAFQCVGILLEADQRMMMNQQQDELDAVEEEKENEEIMQVIRFMLLDKSSHPTEAQQGQGKGESVASMTQGEREGWATKQMRHRQQYARIKGEALQLLTVMYAREETVRNSVLVLLCECVRQEMTATTSGDGELDQTVHWAVIRGVMACLERFLERGKWRPSMEGQHAIWSEIVDTGLLTVLRDQHRQYPQAIRQQCIGVLTTAAARGVLLGSDSDVMREKVIVRLRDCLEDRDASVRAGVSALIKTLEERNSHLKTDH